MTLAVGATFKVTQTYTYCFKLIDYTTPTPNSLDLSALLISEPLKISEITELRTHKNPTRTEALYAGESRYMVAVSAVLHLPSYDPRDLELQVRQIRDFMKAAPLHEVTLMWIDASSGATDYEAYLQRCHLTELHPNRNTGLSPGEPAGNVMPEIALAFVSMEDSPVYVETGDPAPANPTLYGSIQSRGMTNDGSPVLSVVNDVTGETLLALLDNGYLKIRGGFESFATFP